MSFKSVDDELLSQMLSQTLFFCHHGVYWIKYTHTPDHFGEKRIYCNILATITSFPVNECFN